MKPSTVDGPMPHIRRDSFPTIFPSNFLMNFEKLLNELLPPKLAWHATRRLRERRELARFGEFYSQFTKSGGLCIDVGANLGARTEAFLSIGCEVIAVEPQASCIRALEKKFEHHPQVTIVPAALGRQAGTAELHVSPDHVLSSLSPDFVKETTKSGRFARSRWNRSEIVEVRTLDSLIEDHGIPDFIKIDVEGFESDVLNGLSHPVHALCFEWTPELAENALSCCDRLSALGEYEFNLSWGESLRFTRPQWRDADSMKLVIREFSGESLMFGDIYARLR
jgi:FkbM family methyltransferase